MKKFLALILLAMAMTSCDSVPSADAVQRNKQENLEKEAVREVGMPAIHNFYEKKLLKTIYELRDNAKTMNYAYLFAENSGKLILLGRCYGYGVPYATQYTNPQKTVSHGGTDFSTLPQADPNGLFSPTSAEGTWLALIDPKTGEPQITYIEPKLIVSPIPLTTGKE